MITILKSTMICVIDSLGLCVMPWCVTCQIFTKTIKSSEKVLLRVSKFRNIVDNIVKQKRNKKLAAVVVTFLVFEAFRYMTQGQLQFQLIDLRLLLLS